MNSPLAYPEKVRCDRTAATVAAVFASTLTATGALLPLLGVAFSIAAGSLEGMAWIILGVFAVPFAFIAFMLGSALFGPLTYWALERLRIANIASASFAAFLISGAAGWQLFGALGPSGSPEIVVSVAVAGAIGGAVFHRQMRGLRPLRPSPVRPS